MSTLYKYQPDYAVHPGETLKEKLEELSMSAKEFAVRTGKPEKTISEVINGKSSITIDMAVLFEKVLQVPAEFWKKKQLNFDEYVARQEQEKELKKSVDWVKLFPYSELANYGIVKKTKDKIEKVQELLSFFNIAKPSSWDKIYLNNGLPVAFKISLKHAKDPYALSTLLRLGEIIADKIDAPAFNKIKMKELLPQLKEIMLVQPENYLNKIQNLLLSAGVKLVYTPYFPKTVIQGVVRWIDDNPVMQLTDRYKRYDTFWFSLIHELGHVLLHHKKKSIFLEHVNEINANDKEEQEADKFASDFLMKDSEYRKIIGAINDWKNSDEVLTIISKFASENNIHKEIVIGRILFHNKKLYELGYLKKEISQVEISKNFRL